MGKGSKRTQMTKNKSVPKKLDSSVKQFIKKNSSLSITMLAFAVVGSALLLKSFAATPYLSIEPESGNRVGVNVGTGDTTASNNSYVQFVNASYPDFKGEYYNNAALTGSPVLTRNDTTINFNWGLGAPNLALPADNFSVRWTKNQSFTAGTYRFSVTADDGIRLYIDNNLIINQWIDQGATTYTADMTLTAASHAIKVEYYDGTQDAVAMFSYAAAPATCPTGTIGTPPNCVTQQCPTGTTGIYPDCVTNPTGTGQKCIVSLHGKSGFGSGTYTSGDRKIVSPNGNAPGWGGLQWLYYPDSGYQQTKQIVQNAITADGCQRVIIYGFSNGAAMAAKFYCKGETFGGKVIGYIPDDPVTDHAVEGCLKPAGIKLAVYMTGAIDMGAGWDCASGDWTCEGGTTIDTYVYLSHMGTTRIQSPHTTHDGYFGNGSEPPEFTSFW
jgi:hypothetical protein